MTTMDKPDLVKESKIIALGDLSPHPSNYRSHPDEQVRDIMASLVRFGPTRSIVVQEGPQGYLTVAGHGVVEAARRLGVHFLRADIIPADWTPEQVKGYLIADNLHAQKAVDDEAQLAQLLQEQQAMGYLLASLGTDEFALKDMLANLHPPTLDDLTAKYGDEPEDTDFWPIIRVKVSPETKELYDSLIEEAEGSDEGEKFAWVLERVNVAVEA